MDFTKYRGKPWFDELEKNVSDYSDKNNAIESAKFGYDRDMRLPQWVLGIGLSLLLLSKDIIDNLQPIFKEVANLVYLITLIVLIIGILTTIVLNKRHRVGMMYLYREKDKQDNKKKGTRK